MTPLHYACILFLLPAGLIEFYCSGHGLNNLSLVDLSDCEVAEVEISIKETYNS